ncbi:MAG: tryptophan--tRNA ligase [Planctomycetes bacterium]|jgi:tryptophanyl-tRNA synthetase|nr:tryptophan--tRNA ligase [Planctomycetota bacterium]
MDKEAKKRIFSGIQPSGSLHLGNYLGAISKWVELEDAYDCIFCVVDYHAITVKQDPAKLKKNILDIARTMVAAGLDPRQSVIFQQSKIYEHTELAWILNCFARISDLNKMTQFKEKAGKNQESVSVGLYDYPVLMAADILLYQTAAVPVGEDQSQHVEITRTIGRRFNQAYGETFRLPELIVRKEGARIMGLDDPTKKMAKSAKSAYNYIGLTDKPEEAAKKIARAVTDSGREIVFNRAEKPAIANLLTIFSLLDGRPIKKLEEDYRGKGYGDFKKDLAAAVKKFLTGFQEKFYAISDDEVRRFMAAGAERIRPVAQMTMKKVKEKLGVI